MARSSIVVLVLAVGLLLAGCNDGRRSEAGAYQGETSARIEPTAPTTTSSTLGIDLRRCPKAQPEELPPDALAGATETALDQVPSVFGDVKATEGAYALAAYRMKGGSGPFGPRPGMVRQMCRERPQYGERLLKRSVEVDLIFPKLRPSASLSLHTVFVARFEGDYWVYGVGH